MNSEDFNKTFNLPFKEAEAFFRQKLNIPTREWTDLWQQEQAKGFMSAGAMKAELLSDLRGMADEAVAGKISVKDFRARFRPLVEKHGWQLKGGGPGWRADLIYRTNVATAYQAGRWRQMQNGGVEYLRYVHADGVVHPRPQHLAMHGTVRPIDDIFWGTNYPPNGFRCHCRAEPVSSAGYAATEPELKRRPDGWQTAPDTGWRYNVGSAGDKGYEALTAKFETLPPEIAKGWIREFVKQPAFAQFVAGQIKGNFPVAVLDEQDRLALGTTKQTVWLSRKTLDGHLDKHPEIGLGDYQMIPEVISDGEVYLRPVTGRESERLIFLKRNGKLYRAAVKATADKGKNFFLSLFETTDGKALEAVRSKYNRIR